MKVRAVGKRSRFPVIQAAEWFFLLAGLAALDVYIWIHTTTLLYQAYNDWGFDQKLRGLEPSVRAFVVDEISSLLGFDRAKPEVAELPALPPKGEPAPATEPLVIKPPEPSSVIGRLQIPDLHLSVMVREGADAHTLRRAVGHIPGTALPGMAGNIGLAGHRDTFFRALSRIRKDDPIELETEYGYYRYLVESTQIVGPRDVRVLASSGHETLTLVTCYPFYYVGSAPKRFIVRAALVSQTAQRRATRGE